MSGDGSDSNRPAPGSFASWNAYWTAHGMQWRTEPEIGAKRQAYLAERRAIVPDIEQGLFPFKGIKLERADVEWLLAAHESGGIRGPVDWNDCTQHGRVGLDLRGADLGGEDLRDLPLARLRGGLLPWSKGGIHDEWFQASPSQREAAAIHLQNSNVAYAHLEGAILAGGHLEGALLQSIHLESARLREVHMQGARLNGAYLDRATNLIDASLCDDTYGSVHLADIRWGEANLAWMNWAPVKALGNEQHARLRLGPGGKRKDSSTRLHEYLQAVRAYQQVMVVIRNQGLREKSDLFAYRAQLCQRIVLRRQRNYLRFLGSLMLDLISGYGYRPLRSVLTYVLTIVGFAFLYWCVTNDISLTHGLFTQTLHLLGMTPPPASLQHFQPYEAVVVSMTSFHGRGFFQPVQSPGDKVAILAAIEAAIGLLLEVTFIATFTQRFFAR